MVATAIQPSFSPRQHKLRTYVVLNAKSSRGRLASFGDLLEEAAAQASSPMAKPEIPDECLAYESYAAVASRFQSPPSARELRWSDISRPRLHLATLLPATGAKQLSQKARRRQLRRARSSSGSQNDHLECHALELCFEFLALPDLQRAASVCTEFRDVIMGSGRLVMGIYARTWRGALASADGKPVSTRLARKFYELDYKTALAMIHDRRADFEYTLATRSQVTKRPDATFEILNNSLLRVLTRGAVDSARGVKPLPVLSSARALGAKVSYFEVAMSGCGSVGLVSLSDETTRRAYGYGSDEHVGWKGVSFGYHGNDGDFVYNDGAAPYGGEWAPYGPSWGVRNAEGETAVDTVGCGLNLATRQVFFTLNGRFLGLAPFVVPEGEYAAAVSLHEFNDRAVLNAGSAPFRFDIEGFCASL